MTTAKNDAFICYWVELTFGGRESKFGGEGVNEQIRGWWGDSPIPHKGKPCINFSNMFLYTMKKLHAYHIHHVPKWPPYFC